jgi:cell division protein FtsL
MKLAVNRPEQFMEFIYGFDVTHPYFQMMTLCVSLMLLVGTVVGNVYIQHQNKLLNSRAIGMQVELSDLAALGHEIQLEEQGLNRYDRIKLIAAKRLGLTDVKSNQIIEK